MFANLLFIYCERFIQSNLPLPCFMPLNLLQYLISSLFHMSVYRCGHAANIIVSIRSNGMAEWRIFRLNAPKKHKWTRTVCDWNYYSTFQRNPEHEAERTLAPTRTYSALLTTVHRLWSRPCHFIRAMGLEERSLCLGEIIGPHSASHLEVIIAE